MARILGNASDKLPAAATSKARALTVGGVRWTHAAALFWAALLDEVAADYPEGDTLIFETTSGTILKRDLLFPETALQLELESRKPSVSIEQALKEALAEFEIFGPPGAVQFRLLASDREIRRCSLPLDCVDADIFAYLLAWLMEWAELPENQWNGEDVKGAFMIRDNSESRGAAGGGVQFEFTRAHISEGLYRWRLLMRRAAGKTPGN